MVLVAHVLMTSLFVTKPPTTCVAFKFGWRMTFRATMFVPSVPASRKLLFAGAAFVVFIIVQGHDILY